MLGSPGGRASGRLKVGGAKGLSPRCLVPPHGTAPGIAALSKANFTGKGHWCRAPKKDVDIAHQLSPVGKTKEDRHTFATIRVGYSLIGNVIRNSIGILIRIFIIIDFK